MRQLEGGWLSNSAIERSKERIQRLPYVEKVEFETKPVPGSADLVDVNYTIKEGLPGQFGGGIGYSESQKFSLNGNFVHSNFLGSGERIALEINAGKYSKSYTFAQTDPYTTVDNVSRTASLTYRDITQFVAASSAFSTKQITGALQWSYPITEYQYLTAGMSANKNSLVVSQGYSAQQSVNWVKDNGNTFQRQLTDTNGDGVVNSLDNPYTVFGTDFYTYELTGGWSYEGRNRALFPDRGMKIQLSARYALTTENLRTDFIPGVVYADSIGTRQGYDPNGAGSASAFSPQLQPLDDDTATSSGTSQQFLSQVERSLGLRYAAEPTSHLHYTFAAYYSNYSTFGHSIDPRFGFVWTPTAQSALRFSVGSTFQSPQLPTFIVPPVYPQPVDGYVSIGNPNATAERATSYDLGYDHAFHLAGLAVRVGGDLYRTDLHNGVATYNSPTLCVPGQTYTGIPPCLSYPVNVTQEVYQGIELHGDVPLSAHDSLHAGYDVDSVYTQAFPALAADDVVPYEQALGVPLHKFTLDYEHDPGRGLAYYAGLLYEGAYNETNLGPYAVLRAGATWHLPHFDIGIYGTNLTDVYDFKQERVGGGLPYGGLNDVVQTDAIPLAPRTITLSIAHKI